MDRNTSVDELYHYGVKGMKWGVRHEKWKTKTHKRIDKRYDKKVTKSQKKYDSQQRRAKNKQDFYAAKNSLKLDKYVHNNLRKLEHKRVNDVSLEQYTRWGKAKTNHMVMTALFGMPGNVVAVGSVIENQPMYRATRDDVKRVKSEYFKRKR